MPGSDRSKIATLGGLCGITPEYQDNFGARHQTSTATYKALLTAMRVPWEDPLSLEQEIARRRLGPWRALLEPVQVASPRHVPEQVAIRVWSPTATVPAGLEVRGTIVSENGERITWETRLHDPPVQDVCQLAGGFRLKLSLPLPQPLALGYYDLALEVRAGDCAEAGQTKLIAAPERAYFPEELTPPHRLWGFNVPLYALRSAGDWGLGDFASLKGLLRWAGSLGAAFVGVNPLHAASACPESYPSPYAPASRVFLNFLYLRLEEAPEMAFCSEAQALLAGPEFHAARDRLQRAPLVLYDEAYGLKRRVLKLLYQALAERHGPPETPNTSRGRQFAAFLAARGKPLARFGEFCALAEFLEEGDWRRWPEAYRRPDSPAVAEFAASHLPEIRCHQYAQWLAATQLAGACQEAREQGLPFTLYEDLALGASPGGFDAWAQPELFALEVAIGAPPDAFNLKGQNWGLPPLLPERLRDSGYQLFIDTLQANMPAGGMLRLDHVMGLFRLFWIPADLDVSYGAYVNYPARELLAILALESVRRQALIIGEDLGTVPDCIRRDLAASGILSYRVFYFERDEHHRFLPPEDYPALAMAAVTTHDLPTLAGFCQGRDLALKHEFNLYSTPELEEADARHRQRDLQRLAETLEGRGVLPPGASKATQTTRSCPKELRAAVLEYLAQSRAALLEVRLEDVFGVVEQQNLPGTSRENHNWRQKLPLTLEEMSQDKEAPRLAARLNKYRGVKKAGDAP